MCGPDDWDDCLRLRTDEDSAAGRKFWDDKARGAGYKSGMMTRTANVYFWYFSYPTPLADGGVRIG